MTKRITTLFATAALVFGIASALQPVEAIPGNCNAVRCAACPDGYHLRLKWPNCCQCIPN